jgi:serine/threonine-protein kinase
MNERDVMTGAVVAARYRLEALRPGGADSSNVFDATDLVGGGQVVVRLVLVGPESTDDDVEQFKRHLLAVSGSAHPVLVSPLDWGETTIGGQRHVFVVTERLAGTSLRELLDRSRRLSPSQAIVLALDLCRALVHLQANGLAHGDIRPANVFVTPDSRARLAGMGTKRGISGMAAMSVEQSRYAAPELAQDPTPSAASDMYALALTVLETLTGEVPFAADSPAVTLANRAGKLLPVSADLGAIAATIEKAARPDAADRSSAQEFGRALAQVAAKLPPPAALEMLETESFRDAITRTLETVVAAPPVGQPDAATQTQKQTEPKKTQVSTLGNTKGATVDIAIAAPAGERNRFRVVVGVAIVVALAVAGVLVWQAASTKSYAVPDVVGAPEGEARNDVALFGWNLLIRAERSDDIALGSVIRTVPPAGTLLREGRDLVIVVSEGATLAVVPDVTGLSRDEALAALAAQGLVVSESLRDDDTVPAGKVVSWIVTEQPNLAAGSQVLRGTQVAIVVSGGPVLRSAPNLVGRSEADALAQLESVQLVGQRNDDVYSGEIAVGLVASQDPQPGAQLARSGIVAFSLSKGPEMVELPNVIGLVLKDAEKKLSEAGIGIATISGRSTSKVRSVSQAGKTLKAGDPVQKGSAVNLVFP